MEEIAVIGAWLKRRFQSRFVRCLFHRIEPAQALAKNIYRRYWNAEFRMLKS